MKVKSWGNAVHSHRKRALALFLSFVMVFNTIPTNAVAEDTLSAGNDAAIVQDDSAPANEQPTQQTEELQNSGGREQTTAPEAQESQEGEGADDEGDSAGADVEDIEPAPAQDDQATPEVSLPAFDQEAIVGTMRVRVQLPEGAFPADAKLEVNATSDEESQSIASAVEVVRSKDREVVASRALKIVVRGNGGNPLQPANGAKARVSFGLGDYKDDQFTAEVFSIRGAEKLEAKSLAVTKDGEFATVTDTDATTFDVLFTRARKATPTFPAFSQQAKLDGVTIKVSASEGVFPEGAKLDVKKVSAAAQKKASDAVDEVRDSNKEVATSYAFDIKVLNKNGTEVQPADDAKVNVSFATAEVAKQELTTEVFHIDDETGKAESLAVKETGTTAKVVVDGFSIYVITFAADGTTVASPAFATYKFYTSESAETPVRSQKVKQGDNLYEPSTPVPPEGKKFIGWYVGNEKLNFTSEGKLNLATLHVSANGVVNVYAKYDTYHYVTFYDQDNNVFTRMSVVDGGSIAQDALPTFTPNLSTQTLVGWSETKGDTTAVAFPLENITDDKSYYPIIQQSHVLTFDVNRLPHMQEDASTGTKQLTVSYTPPQTIAPGGTTVKPADPTCESSTYTFGGWYTDSACTTRFTFGQALSQDTTVYAKWTEGQAQYKVVVWKENIGVFYNDASRNTLTPENYEYYKTYERTANPLGTVTLASNDEAYSVENGFEIAHSGSNVYGKPGSAKVMPDGSTVLNVYWNRQTKKAEFYRPYNKDDYEIVSNLYFYYNNWVYDYDISGLYGQPFAMYKSTGASKYEKYVWPNNVTGDTVTQFVNQYNQAYNYYALTDHTALRAYFNDSLSPKYYIDPNEPIASGKVYYVLQKADGSWPTSSEASVPSTSNGTVLSVNFDTSRTSTGISRTSFENFNGAQYSINSYADNPNDSRRKDIPSDNKIPIPSGTNAIYAYFNRDSFPIEFYNRDGSKNNSLSSSRLYESSLANCASYKLNDTATERFVGWATDPGQTDVSHTVDFSKLTVPDYTLRFYPIYATDQVNVKLKLAGDDAAASEVTLSDQQSTSFWPNVNDTIDMTLMNQATRDGYELEGWYTQDGTKWTEGTQLAPGLCAKDANGNPILNEPAAGYSSAYYTITLTARWHAAAQAPVVYKGDGTSGISDSDIYTLNGDVKVSPSLPSSGNKTFIGWRDLNGNMHQPGDTFTFDSKVLLNSEGELELTAVYTAKDNPTTKVTYHANYSGSSATSNSDELEWNDTLVLPDNTFTRNGYRIAGWSTTPGATTPDSGFETGKTVGVNAMGATIDASSNTATIDLYAVWEDAATLTFAPNNGEYGSVDKTSILVGKYTTDSVTVVATPADGYHLVNWTKDGAEVSTDATLTLTKPVDGWVNANYVAVFHKHDWTWESKGNKVVATCANSDHAHKGDTTVALTLNVEDVTYLTPVSASIDNKSGMVETGTEVGEITFEGRDGTSYGPSTTAPELVGTYTAKVTVTKNGHPYIATKDFTIKPKGPSDTEELTFDLADDPQTYDGTEHKPQVTNVKLGDILLEEGRGYRVEYANNVNAGTATAKVILMGNFSGEKAETFTINKADITPAIDVAPKTYDGKPIEPTISNNPGNGSVTYTYEKRDANDGWSTFTGTPIDAGTYRAKATIAETDNYNGATTNTKEFTISKANPVVTAPTANAGLTFNGGEQALVTAGTTTGGTMKYSLNGTDWQDTVPTATNAGDYTVYYKVDGNDNYNGVEPKTVSVTIGTRTLNSDDYAMTLDKTEFTYNKDVQKPAVTIKLNDDAGTMLVEGTDFDVKYFDKDGKEIAAADSKNASGYSVKVVFKGNYAGESGEQVYTIKPKELTASDVTFTGDNFTYTGTPQGPTITVKDGEDELAPTLNYNVVNDKNTNVGTYTVTVTGKGNYTGTVERQYTIGQSSLDPTTLTIAQKPSAKDGLVYSGADQELINAPAEVPAGYTIQYSLDGSTWSAELPKGKNAGTYNVHVRYKGDDNHRDLTLSDPISVTVARKPVTITPQAGQSKVFGTSNPATYTYSQSGVVSGETLTGTLGRADGENVGEYEFNVSEFTAPGANPNYDIELAADAPTFSITKADQATPATPILTATPTSVTVNNGKAGVTYTLCDQSGNPVGGNGTVMTPNADGSFAFSGLNPNQQYIVKAQIAADDNHNASPEVQASITTPKESQTAPSPSLKNGASDIAATDGAIKDVNDTMEYSTNGGETWVPVPVGHTEIEGLAPGEVLVRYEGTDTKDPSPTAKVMVTFKLTGKVTWNYTYNFVDPTTGQQASATVDDTSEQRSKFARVQLYNGANPIEGRSEVVNVSDYASGTTAEGSYSFNGLPTADEAGNRINYHAEVTPLMSADATGAATGYSVNYLDPMHLQAEISFNQECFDAPWKVTVNSIDAPNGAKPDAVFVKVLYGTIAGGVTGGGYDGYDIIVQQSAGNGSTCTLVQRQDGSYVATGSYPVWKWQPKASADAQNVSYYHRVLVTGYIANGTFFSLTDDSNNYIMSGKDPSMQFDGEKADRTMEVTIPKISVPSVEFDPNGGAIQNGYIVVSKGGEVTAAQINAKVPIWEDHTFDGWYTKATGGTKQTENITNITQKKTLYAHWKMIIDPVTNAPTANDLTYNGAAQELVNAPSELPAGCKKIQYSIDGGTTWTDDLPKAVDAGTYTVKVKYVGEAAHADAEGADVQVTIKPKPLTAEDIAATGKGTQLIYSGEAQGPTVAVKDGTTTLEEGTAESPNDYQLADTTATTAGSYAVKVTGTGNYTGTVQVPYTIAPYEIGEDDKLVIGGVCNFTYDGTDQRPTGVTVTLNGTALREGPDFEITYPESSVNAGNYEIAVTFKNNYAGTTTKGYKIVPKLLTDPSITIADAPSAFVFSGTPQGPAITLKDGTTTLTKGTDYKVTGGEATGVGNGYKAVITGTGNYMGKVEKPFSIEPYVLGEDDKLEVIFDGGNGSDEFVYNRADQRPDASKVSVKITKADGTEVTLGADALNVKYLKADGTQITTDNGSTDAGTYQVQVELKSTSGYTGSTKRGYVINPKPITAGDVEFNGPTNFEYTYATQSTGDGILQGPTASVTSELASGRTNLEAGRDYTVADAPKYDAGSYTMVVKGTGNFCGEVTKPYTIRKAQTQESDLTDANKPTVNKTEGKDGLVYNAEEQVLVTGPTTMPEGYVEVLYSTDGGTTWATDPKGTNVGDYTVQVKYVGDKNHEDFTISPHTATIVKRVLKIAGNSDTKAYNGAEQSVSGYATGTATNEGLVSGHAVSGLTHIAKGTAKSPTDNDYQGVFTPSEASQVAILDTNKTNVSANYDVELTTGKLTITAAAVTDDGTIDDHFGDDSSPLSVTGSQGDNAPTYDAQPHKPVVVDKQATDENGNPKTLVEGTDYDVKYYAPGDINPDGSVKENAQELTPEEAGEKVAVVELKGDYSGTIKVRVDVKKRPVTFTGQTAERAYNGKEQEITGITVEGDGLVSGHTHNLSYSASGTAKGEYPGTFTYGESANAVVIKDASGADVTANYQITDVTTTVGKLTIKATNVDANDDGTADNLTDDKGNTITGTDGKPVHVVDLFGTDGTTAPVYDDQDHKPTVWDNSYVNPSTGEREPKTLEEGPDYTVAYYEANPDGTPNMEKEITGEDAPKVAGDKVAVVTFTGDYSGSLTVPVDVQKRPVTFAGKTVVAHFDTQAHEMSDRIGRILSGNIPFSSVNPNDETNKTYVVLGQDEMSGLVDTHTTLHEGTDTVNYNIKDVKLPVKDGEGTITDPGYPINAGVYQTEFKNVNAIAIYRTTDGTDVTANYDIKTTTGTYTILQSELHNNGEGWGVIPPNSGEQLTDASKVIHVYGKTLSGTGEAAAEVYDGTAKEPVVKDEQQDHEAITLVKGENYDIAYYAPSDVTYVHDDQLNTDTIPQIKEGARQLTPEEAGEKIAVVTLKGNLAGTITARMDVKQRPVTFTGNSATKAYNGQKQTVEGYEASTGENEGLLDGHTTTKDGTDSIAAKAEGTNASETPYAGTITAAGDVKIYDASGTDVTKNYDITTTAGSLTISKAKVADGGVGDDGNASGVKANDGGQPVDQGGQLTTDPNQYVKVVDVRGKDGDDDHVYDGTPRKPVVYDVQNTDESGNPKQLEEGKDYTVKYYDANDIDENGQPKTNAQEVDPADAGQKVAVVTLNGDYDGTVNVPMNVQKRQITFTGDRKSFSYDGKQHVVDTLTVADQGLVDGHTYGIRYRAEGTEKGDYAGAFVWPNRDASSVVYDSNNTSPDTTGGFVFDAQGKDVTANYTISFKLGNLQIGATKIQDNDNGEGVEVNDQGEPVIGKDGKPAVRVNVTVDYDNGNPPVYDGKDHAPTVHDVQGNKDLTEGTDYTITYYNMDDIDGEGNPKPGATPTTAANAGEKVAVVEFIHDYTGSVKVDTQVLKRPVTFTGNSAEKSYNGAKQTVEGYTASTGANEGLLTGDEFGHTTTPATAGATDTVSAKAEGVSVGSYTGTITASADVKIYDKAGKEQTSNYQIQTEPGTLTIKPAKIGDGGNSKGYVTDNFGNPVDDEGNLAKSEDGKPVRDAEGNPVGQDGKPIKPAIDVTSKGGDDTPTYDGSPKDPVVVDNKATDQSGEPQPKTLEKGTDYDVEYFEPKRDDEGNYVDDDGKPTDTPVPDRDKPTDPADAGEKIAVITLKGDYDGIINKPITIAPASLAIRTGSATKPYDGTPLTNKEVTIDGLAKGETVEVEVTGSQTEIGSSKNTFTTRFAGETEAVAAESAEAAPKDDTLTAQSSLFVGQSEETPLFRGLDATPRTSAVVAEAAEPTAKRSNYDLAPAAETEGTLTVISEDVTGNVGKPDEGKRIEVTPIPSKGSKPNGNDTSTYTGKPVDSPVLYDTNKTDENGEPKKLEEGTDYDVTYYETNPDGTPNLNKPLSGKPTDAGTYAMVVTFKGAYTGSHTMPVTISKAKLTVTTPSAKKTYDGKALTTGKTGATIKGFVNGETAPFEVTGTQTQVGSSKNTYTISWDDSEATAKESNYTVTEKLGTLTVSATKSTGSSSSASTKASTPKTGDPTLAALPLAMGAAFTTLIGFRRRRRTK